MPVTPYNASTAAALILKEAVKAYRERDQLINRPEMSTNLTLTLGRMAGLRVALCVLHGWDIDVESDKEGAADASILEAWRLEWPEEWSEARDE